VHRNSTFCLRIANLLLGHPSAPLASDP
jgi:hypothetical protein